jgi:hypothetical protein
MNHKARTLSIRIWLILVGLVAFIIGKATVSMLFSALLHH